MCIYFKTETDVAQNLIDDFSCNSDCQKTFPQEGLTSGKTEVLFAELDKGAEAATCSYSATGTFLQNIYFVLMAENNQKIQSRCLDYKFSFTDVFNDINHGYTETILKKSSS